MAECICLPGCGFYNDKMSIERGIGKMYKERYCLGNNTNCARFMVFSKFGKGTVPDNLYPNQIERAENIIKGLEPHV